MFPIKSYFAWTSKAHQTLKNFSNLLRVFFVVFPPHRKLQSSGGISTETVKGMKTRCTPAAPCLLGINGVRVCGLSVMWRCCQQESESDVNMENSGLDLLDRLWLLMSLSSLELSFHTEANAHELFHIWAALSIKRCYWVQFRHWALILKAQHLLPVGPDYQTPKAETIARDQLNQQKDINHHQAAAEEFDGSVVSSSHFPDKKLVSRLCSLNLFAQRCKVKKPFCFLYLTVANKWIHEHGQEFQHRCSLNPDEWEGWSSSRAPFSFTRASLYNWEAPSQAERSMEPEKWAHRAGEGEKACICDWSPGDPREPEAYSTLLLWTRIA